MASQQRTENQVRQAYIAADNVTHIILLWTLMELQLHHILLIQMHNRVLKRDRAMKSG